MIRKSVSVLVGAGVLGIVAIVACGDRILDSGIPKGTGGGGGQGGAATGCWPTDTACYGENQSKDKPGGECLAVRDNTTKIDSNGIQHIQLRQNWIRATTPLGNTVEKNAPVYTSLNAFTQLPWSQCRSNGTSGYIQVFDFLLDTKDQTKGESWVGFAKYVAAADLDTTLKTGLCMVDDVYPRPGDTDPYALPDSQMSDSTGYPVGLPKPMGRATTPWHPKPTHAKRLAADFDLKGVGNGYPTKREELLASFEPGGANYGYDGVFFYNATTGESHGFARMSFLVIYEGQSKYITVPIREPETHATFNDPAHPNCVGAYRGDALDPANGCASSNDPNDPTFPPWGFPGDPPDKRGQGPATTDGYFLITEIEQVYSSVLQMTLCVSYPTYDVSNAGGWAAGNPPMCRNSPNWNPTAANDAGLPQGDWCAATNSPATSTSTCHDAYHSHSFHVFSAFPVIEPSVPMGDAGPVADAGTITGTCKAY